MTATILITNDSKTKDDSHRTEIASTTAFNEEDTGGVTATMATVAAAKKKMTRKRKRGEIQFNIQFNI